MSQGDLDVNLTHDYVSTGQFQAQNNAKFYTSGVFTNQAELTAGNQLTVHATTIHNNANSKLNGQNTSVIADQVLDNTGLIDGNETKIQADTLQNSGTGRIYGNHLAIQANTIINSATAGAAPILAAREQLDIAANTIKNQEHAKIFSAGDMNIGGSLDENNQAIGQAAILQNNSAEIESLGNLNLAVQKIYNTNDHFSTALKVTKIEDTVEYQGSGSTDRYVAGTKGVEIYNDESDHLRIPGKSYENWTAYRYKKTITESQIVSSDPASIKAGGNLRIQADLLNNDKSSIIAGGSILGTIGTLNNLEGSGQKITTGDGKATSYWRHRRKGRDNTGSRTVAYKPAPVVETISLAATVYQQGTAAGDTGLQIDKQNLNAADTGTINSNVNAASQGTNVPNVNVAGKEENASNVNAAGKATNTSNVHVAGKEVNASNLNVAGQATNASTVNVAGKATNASTVNIAGKAANASTVNVAGKTANTSNVNVAGKAANASDVNVAGQEVNASNVNVAGQETNASNVNVAGKAANASNVNVAGKEVTASKMNVAGSEATNSNANVVGKAATTSNVNLADRGTNNSNVNVGNQKNLKGTISPITELSIQNGGMIRTGAVDTRVPSNSLFSVTPTSNSQYLIETDPNFSDYRKWLSSDYMLKLVDYDPGVVQKRLGDGFYEQNLIRSEVTALTGKRFLSGYYSDEDQYQALMNNAVAFAKQNNLQVGKELSTEQLANLKTDIVWMVEKDVLLPSGQITKALVP